MVAGTLLPPAALYQRGAHELFLQLGLEIAGHKYAGQTLNLRRFRSVYGVRPEACAEAWNDLLQFTPNMPNGCHPCHLFWFLKFLRQYPTEHQLAGHVHSTEETVRFLVWFIGLAIRDLKPRKVRSVVHCDVAFPFELRAHASLFGSARLLRSSSAIATRAMTTSSTSCRSTRSIAEFMNSLTLRNQSASPLTSSQ